MKTMGLTQLSLVNPNPLFPNAESTARAAGADEILVHAQLCDSLDSALTDCHLIIGTSARQRRLEISSLEPHACGKLVATTAVQHDVAIVFGREHAGLTNAELNRCHYHVHIPTDPNFSSLNLAAAVQILTYEIRINYLANTMVQPTTTVPTFASDHEVQLLYQQLEHTLANIGFLKKNSPRKLMPRLQRLFNRAHLEKMELDLLMGIFRKIHATINAQESS